MSEKRKLNTEDVAKRLGCSHSFEVKGDCILVKICGKGEPSERAIRKLSEEEIGGFVFLGAAEGQDIFHCIYIAARHCENFWERADGFRIMPPTHQGMAMTMEFYGKKK